MMQLSEVSAAALEAAKAKLPPGISALRADTQAISDSEGKEALRVLLVLDDSATQMSLGDAALSVIVTIVEKLQSCGEMRFPVVEFATEDELQADADPES